MSKNKLTRRDFLKLAGATSAGLALSACGVKATELPTATLTSPTGTPLPTETLTPTPTSTPILPLEQLPQTRQVLAEFTRAFQSAGIDISADQLVDKGIDIKTYRGVTGKEYRIATVSVSSSMLENLGDVFIAMVFIDDNWVPIKNGGRLIADMVGVNLGTQVVEYRLPAGKIIAGIKNDVYRDVVKNFANTVFNSGTLGLDAIGFVQISQDGILSYDFSKADSIARFASENGQQMQIQALIVGERVPKNIQEYIRKDPTTFEKRTPIAQREVAIGVMKQHIKAIIEHFPNAISFEVVSEAFDWNKLKGFWHETIGDDYIEIAFTTANDVLNNLIRDGKIKEKPKLIYSDVNVSNGAIDDHERAVFNLVRNLKNRGIEVVYGAEMHINTDTVSVPFDKNAVKSYFEQYAKHGIELVITEADMFIGSDSQEKIFQQGKTFAELIAVLKEIGTRTITFYGLQDEASWLEVDSDLGGRGLKNANPTLFDKDGRPKFAFYTFINSLFQNFCET